MGFYSNNETSRALPVGAELNEVLYRVYTWMAFGLLTTAGVAYLVANTGLIFQISRPVFYILMFVPLGLVFYLNLRIHKMSANTASAVFLAYAALMGVTLSVIFIVYTNVELTGAMLITAGMFGGMTLLGRSNKVDMSRFRGALFAALIGLVIASIVNLFMQSNGLYWLISYAGVLIFAGLIAYDTQWITRMAREMPLDDNTQIQRLAIIGALHMYMNVVNLFLFILRILGGNRR